MGTLVHRGIYMKIGTHIDFTTLLGAVDALKLVPETRDMPITFEHLLTLSQFFDSIVLHERVFYENSTIPQHQPYDELIEDSAITRMLNPKILIAHQNPLVDDNFKVHGIEWAIGNVYKVNPESFLYSVTPRTSHYRAIKFRQGIEDLKNAYTEYVFDTAKREGDSLLAESIDKALKHLDDKRIGRMGLHVMYRLYHLEQWLSTESGISYFPNYSRNALIEEALLQRKRPRNFMRWAIVELKKKRKELITSVMDASEIDETTFELSPVFLHCLKEAKHPVDVLDNAMRLRGLKAAKRIREVHSELSNSAEVGEDKTVSLRRELKKALKDFDNEKEASNDSKITFKGAVSPAGPKAELSIQKNVKGNIPITNTTFLIEALRSSLTMVNAMEAIERVFGTVSTNDQWILSTNRL